MNANIEAAAKSPNRDREKVVIPHTIKQVKPLSHAEYGFPKNRRYSVTGFFNGHKKNGQGGI